MLATTSGTISEQISIQFYRISFLKLQILHEMISKTSSKVPGSEGHLTASHREELQSWFDEWNREVEVSVSEDDNHVPLLQLKTWASFSISKKSYSFLDPRPPRTFPKEKHNNSATDLFRPVQISCTTEPSLRAWMVKLAVNRPPPYSSP